MTYENNNQTDINGDDGVMLHLRLRPGADAEPDREGVCVPRTQVKEIPSSSQLQGSVPLFHRHQADDKTGGGGKALHPLQDLLQKKGGIICLPCLCNVAMG